MKDLAKYTGNCGEMCGVVTAFFTSSVLRHVILIHNALIFLPLKIIQFEPLYQNEIFQGSTALEPLVGRLLQFNLTGRHVPFPIWQFVNRKYFCDCANLE